MDDLIPSGENLDFVSLREKRKNAVDEIVLTQEIIDYYEAQANNSLLGEQESLDLDIKIDRLKFLEKFVADFDAKVVESEVFFSELTKEPDMWKRGKRTIDGLGSSHTEKIEQSRITVQNKVRKWRNAGNALTFYETKSRLCNVDFNSVFSVSEFLTAVGDNRTQRDLGKTERLVISTILGYYKGKK